MFAASTCPKEDAMDRSSIRAQDWVECFFCFELGLGKQRGGKTQVELLNKVCSDVLKCRNVEEAWRFQECSACKLLQARRRMCGSNAGIDEDCGRVDVWAEHQVYAWDAYEFFRKQ